MEGVPPPMDRGLKEEEEDEKKEKGKGPSRRLSKKAKRAKAAFKKL
jgi:hypothetical protein